MLQNTKVLPVIVLFLWLANVCLGVTITVKKDGSGDYTSIQEAIDNSSSGYIVEVHPGTYYERINFYNKALTVTSTEPNNINVVYATTIDGSDTGNAVTFDSGEDNSSILTGITLQNANNGIYCYYSDPLISYCVIRSNGYGIYGNNSAPAINDCVIRENLNRGIYKCDGTITNCVIRENEYGVYECIGLITNCEISENVNSGVIECGGLITNCEIIQNGAYGVSNCDGSINNCVISRNSGNGLRSFDGDIVNCLISGNSGDGIRFSSANIRNCTIIGNRGDGLYECSGFIVNNIIVMNWAYGLLNCANSTLKYNNVWGNPSGSYSGVAPGATDTHENPRFAIDGYWDGDNWIEGEYYLKSIAGRWDPNSNIWVNDEITSLCIDAGDPSDSVGDEPHPNGGRINMGAYGGTTQASKTPITVTVPGIVENLTVQGGHEKLTLDWDEPFDDGGLAISAYKIYRGPSAGALTYYTQVSGAELTCIDSGVDNGVEYYYAVSAVNGVGEGEQSSPVNATASWNDYDLNGDGIIDIFDFAMFSNEWAWEAAWH